MSINFKCAKEAVEKFKKVSTIEQYMFGFSSSVVVFSTDAQVNPFYVVNFDNISQIKNMRRFDNRIDAHKEAIKRWMYGIEY